jgi:hypothetical protein
MRSGTLHSDGMRPGVKGTASTRACDAIRECSAKPPQGGRLLVEQQLRVDGLLSRDSSFRRISYFRDLLGSTRLGSRLRGRHAAPDALVGRRRRARHGGLAARRYAREARLLLC